MTSNKTIAHERTLLPADRQRFKEFLRRRLTECGWRDQVRVLCRDVVRENNSKNIPFDVDMLAEKVKPRARELIPDSVEKELLDVINTHLLTTKDQKNEP